MFEHDCVALTNVSGFNNKPVLLTRSATVPCKKLKNFCGSQLVGSALPVKLYNGKLGVPKTTRNVYKGLFHEVILTCVHFLTCVQNISEHLKSMFEQSPKWAKSFHRMVPLQDGLVKYPENIHFPSIFKILDQSKRFRGQLFLQRSWMIVSCQDGRSHSLSLILVAWAV